MEKSIGSCTAPVQDVCRHPEPGANAVPECPLHQGDGHPAGVSGLHDLQNL